MTPAIWTAMYAELPLPDALLALHADGWRAFEISTEHLVAIETDDDAERRIADALACLHDRGLDATQAHALLRADVADPDPDARATDLARLLRHLEIAADLGVRHVVIHPGGARRTPETSPDVIRRHNVDAFRRLGDAAGQRAMRIGIENLMRPGCTTAAELLDLLDAIDHPAIGITIDTSHAHARGLDLPATIHQLGPHLIATHLSDNHGASDEHLVPGGGTIAWPAVMAALRDTGYTGIANLEIPGERHPDPALRRLKTKHAFEVCSWLVQPA